MSNEDTVVEDTFWWAQRLTDIANENPRPDSGTLGFLGGLAIALGGGVAVYVEAFPTNRERREFLELILGQARSTFKEYKTFVSSETRQ